MTSVDDNNGMLSEADVGIDVFVTQSPGFGGVLKTRYRDFQVHEIDRGGRMAKLTSLAVPVSIVHQPDLFRPVQPALLEVAVAEFAGIAGDGNAAILRSYLDLVMKKVPDSDELVVDKDSFSSIPPAVLGAISDKQQRKAVHDFLKVEQRLPPLSSDTMQVPVEGAPGGQTESLIRLQLRTAPPPQPKGERGQKGGRGQKRKHTNEDGWGPASDWPGGPRHNFARFVMYKENMDTQAAVSVIARSLHCGEGALGFAGTKDKRGITTQYMTAYKVTPQRLAALNSRLWGVRLGNFEFAEEGLRLGMLQGNHFAIIIRNLAEHAPQQVAAACEEVATKGFINYFGLQRFGTGSAPTHRVGAALLRGEFKEAGELILKGRLNERQEHITARALYFEQGDIQGALRAMPSYLVAERAVLDGLVKAGSANWATALLGVPRTMRMMYLHAYQSYMWNRAASHRISTYGAERAVAGDLVFPPGPTGSAAPTEGVEQNAEGVEDALMVEAGEDSTAGGGDMATSAGRLDAVHVVTKEEEVAGTFSIDDVVLPLPGARSVYPTHASGQVYKQIAAADGVDLEGCPHRVKEFSFLTLTGDYRRLLHRPRDLTWHLHHHTDPNDDSLITTDLEEMGGTQAPPWKLPRLATPGAVMPAAERGDAAMLVGESRDAAMPTAEGGEAAVPVAERGGAGEAAGCGDAAARGPTMAACNDAGTTEELVGGWARTGGAAAAGGSSDDSTISNAPRNAGNAASAGGDQPEAGLGVHAQQAGLGPPATSTDGQQSGGDADSCGRGAAPAQPGQATLNGGGPTAPPPAPLLSVELRFSLPSSTYATTLLREVMKCSMSKAFHMALQATVTQLGVAQGE